MAKYIDADEAMQIINNYAKAIDYDCDNCKVVIDAIKDIVSVICPAADVEEVKHGHFVRNERNIPKMKEFHEKGFALSMNTKSIFWTCSCCGNWGTLIQKYCSECGAKMDGGNKNDL